MSNINKLKEIVRELIKKEWKKLPLHLLHLAIRLRWLSAAVERKIREKEEDS